MRGHGVAAAGDAVSVDARGAALARDLPAIALPGVGEGVLGIEMVPGRSRRDRFSHHHFTGLYGTAGTRCFHLRISEVPYNASSHASAVEAEAPQIREFRSHHIRKILVRPNIVAFNHPDTNQAGDLNIKPAAHNRADAAPTIEAGSSQVIPADHRMPKQVEPVMPVFQ